jgi:hypothetical protein
MRRAAIFLASGLLFLDGVLMGPMLAFLAFQIFDGPEGLQPIRWWLQEAAGLPPAAVNALHVLSMGPGWILAVWAYGRLSGALKRRGVPVWLRPLPAILGLLLILLAFHALQAPLQRRFLPWRMV